MASMSTAASPKINGHHHVYLQCGKDVEKAFGSHLDYGFRERGLRVFRRKETSREGEKLTPETKGFFENVRVFVLIFSPKYVASSGCLEELHEIMQRHQMSGVSIIPVFYKVKPSDLRWTHGKEGWFDRLLGWFARVLRIPPSRTRGKDGVYAQAIRSLERKIPRYESGAINRGRDALSRASDITGLELEKFRDEAELEFVKKPRFAQPAYPVGLNERLHEFERTTLREQQSPGEANERTTLQEQQSAGEAKVVGIFGSGGKGKSTLVEAFFNRKWSEYGRSSFLCDVRKYPLLDLLKELVKDLISLHLKIDGVDDGMEKLSHHLRAIRALIVLDGVDNVEKLKALLSRVRAVLHPDSLIVLVTRNQNILSGLKASSIYEMRGLDAEQSKELFSWHAFHQARPVDGFEKIVEDFLDGSTGLVSSLKVLGEFFYGNNLWNWEDKLYNISKMLPIRIPRWILLDIACVILGEDRNTSIQIFLRVRSLVFVNHEKCCLISQKDVRMRHHLADLMTDTED